MWSFKIFFYYLSWTFSFFVILFGILIHISLPRGIGKKRKRLVDFFFNYSLFLFYFFADGVFFSDTKGYSSRSKALGFGIWRCCYIYSIYISLVYYSSWFKVLLIIILVSLQFSLFGSKLVTTEKPNSLDYCRMWVQNDGGYG